MDEVGAEVKSAINGMVQYTRCDASVWTTFRWLGNLVYALGWVFALPVELVLNRRMGRRYTGLLPVTISLLVLSAFIGLLGNFSNMFTQPVASSQPRAMWGATPPAPVAAATATGAGIGTGMLLTILLTIVLLALLRHRFANWWRFRSSDQVHSFSNGMPFWIYPPRALLRVVAASSAATERPAASAPPVQLNTVGAALSAAVNEVTTKLSAEGSRALAEWRSGQVPTGTVVWFAATLLHPLLLGGVALLVSQANRPLGNYLAIAAVGIFFKARVQKAFVVESVYDIFDGRIEQDFKRSLSEPVRLDAVERSGYAVPGIARIVEQAGKQSGSTALPPDLASLVTPDGVSPHPHVEPKSPTSSDAML